VYIVRVCGCRGVVCSLMQNCIDQTTDRQMETGKTATAVHVARTESSKGREDKEGRRAGASLATVREMG